MKIGIDLFPLRVGSKRRGISSYTYQLVNELIRIDDQNEYWFFNADETDLVNLNSTIKIFPATVSTKLSRKIDLFLYTSLFNIDYDMVHPAQLRCKTAAIIYDLIPFIFYDNYLAKATEACELFNFERLKMIGSLDRVMAISASAKIDTHQITDYPKEKIDVIYAGMGVSDLKKTFLSSELQQQYRISQNKYIFSIPGMDVRKNMEGMIRAYALLPETLLQQYPLVITCELDKQAAEKYHAMTHEYKVSDKVIFTNYLEDNALVALLTNAALFLFPSFYEGFGLPVLEAFACGIPVVTSHNSSLQEVAGEAAMLVDPHSDSEIANAMQTLLVDAELRQRLVQLGYQQAQQFDWNKTANLALSSFKKCCI